MADIHPIGPAKRGEPLRVLLADDNPDTVLTLATLLAEEGHEVRTLGSGSNVAELACSFGPDVCILDIEMPGKDGYALARMLRDKRSGERPMLIGISGVWVSPSDRFLALMVGFDHFFQKPADPSELIAVLDDFRKGRKAVAPEQRLHLVRRA